MIELKNNEQMIKLTNQKWNIKCGIYQILNIINNKRYIGSSSNLIKRNNRHLDELIKNKHCNLHLQNSFNKHGILYSK